MIIGILLLVFIAYVLIGVVATGIGDVLFVANYEDDILSNSITILFWPAFLTAIIINFWLIPLISRPLCYLRKLGNHIGEWLHKND